jgi:protein TonB
MATTTSPSFNKFLPLALIALVAIGIGAYVVLGRGSKTPLPAATAPGATAPAGNAAAPATPAQEALPELTPQQLLKEASTALREQRLVSPPGNNAFEYYERLLEKDPTNQTARDALRETFPIAIGPVEQDINAGNVDEATRVINLLAKADPNNYTLTILRSKLDAKKKQTEREQAQQAAAAAAAAARTQAASTAANNAAAPAAAAPAAQNNAPATDTASAPATQPGTNVARNTPPASATTPPAPAVPPAPVGETRAAEVVKTTPPQYPPDAVRKRQEGWVEVEFTVTPEGTVANATVVNSEPSRVFNTAALRAVENWTFKPRLENGTAVEEKMRRRIEFKF